MSRLNERKGQCMGGGACVSLRPTARRYHVRIRMEERYHEGAMKAAPEIRTTWFILSVGPEQWKILRLVH